MDSSSITGSIDELDGVSSALDEESSEEQAEMTTALNSANERENSFFIPNPCVSRSLYTK